MVEHLVMSRLLGHNIYSCDFVSHTVQLIGRLQALILLILSRSSTRQQKKIPRLLESQELDANESLHQAPSNN